MNKIIKLIVFSALVIAAVSVVACSSSTPTPTANTTEVQELQAYADPATRITLEGLSENDLAKYTQYGNEAFKGAVTQQALDQISTQMNTQYGGFESVTFLSTEKQGVYDIVHYTAHFEKGDIGVRMVFGTDHLVAGQWFE